MTSPDRRDAPVKRARRADWERNRSAIIEAASGVLAERCAAFDVREIANRSGVGMGTLYRHFPTKEELLCTVVDRLFTVWATNAREVAAGNEDPWDALREFFEQTLLCQERGHALVRCHTDGADDTTRSYTRLLRPIIDELRVRAQAAGALRPDVTTDDLSLLLASLSQSVHLTGHSHPGMWRRLLRISLDGLGTDHPESLPALDRPDRPNRSDRPSPRPTG